MPQQHAPHLLLISHHNSYRIAPYLKAAKKLGIAVTIASQSQHSLVSEVASGIQVDFEKTELTLAKILKHHQTKPFTGILGSDDVTVELTATLAKILKLTHNPPDAALYSTRKDLARAKLKLAHCAVPNFYLLCFKLSIEMQLKNITFPCVLKPLNLTGSRGVIRANNKAEFIQACTRIKSIISRANAGNHFEQSHLLVEDYIDGVEIAYEGYLQQGKLSMITIFDKPEPLVGPFFEETIYVTPSSLPTKIQSKIQQVLQQACTVYGLVTGAIHAECRIDKENNVWILEIASRTIGGDCARLLDNDGFSVEELAIALTMGQRISLNPPQQARGVMMIPIKQEGLLKRVEGLLEASKVPYINKIDIVISAGHELIPLPEGSQYLGYIFASANQAEQVTQALQVAFSLLKFVVTPIFNIKTGSKFL